MTTLYKLPFGTNILEQFVRESAGEKDSLLVLPNRYQMEKVKFSGVDVTGIDTLANRILNENGYLDFEQINRRSQELVIEELIDYMHENGRFTYFDKLYDKPGFLKSMTSFIGQLANTGFNEEEIKHHFELWEEETGRCDSQLVKDREVYTLYSLYRQRLKQENWYDLEGKYHLAVYLLKQETTKIPWKKLRVFGFYKLDRLQIEMFAELAKRVDLSIAMYYGEGKAFEACRDTYNSLLSFCDEKVYQAKEIPCVGLTLSKNIFKDLDLNASSVLSTDGIYLAAFTTRDKEIRYVLTEVKKLLLAGVSPKDVVVVVRHLDNFTGIGSVADEYGLPISLGRSVKLSAHPLFHFVKLLYQATKETHDGAESYFNLLSDAFGSLFLSSFGDVPASLKVDTYFTSSSQARVKTVEFLEEKSDSLEALNSFIVSVQNKLTIEEHAQRLKNYLEGLSMPKIAGALYQAERLNVNGLKSLLEAYKNMLSALKLLVEDYARCGRKNELVSPLEWLNILTEAANSVDLTIAHGRADGIRIMEASSMQGLDYDYVYLMGLRMGEFPTANNENWIYNDSERIGLDMDLPTTAGSYAEDAYFFATTLASARKNIFISYHDEEDGGKSPYVDELQRIFLTQVDGKFATNLSIQAPENKTLASPNELFASQSIRVGKLEVLKYTGEMNVPVAASCADMLHGELFANHHGKLQNEKVLEAVKNKVGNCFSASSLKKYLNCPYAYLLNYAMDLGDGGFKEEEGGAAENGTVIHNTLSGFINEHLNEKLDAACQDDLLSQLDAIYDKEWDDFIAKGKVHNSAFWQSEKPRIRKLLHNWLANEVTNQAAWNYRPMATELKFFDGDTKPRVKLELTDGTKVKLQGAIDRIDSNGEKLFITDYKLSTNSVPTQKALAEGTDLQMNIYLLAAKQFYGDKIAGGGYYVIKGLTRKPNLLLDEVGIIKSSKSNKPFEFWEDFASKAKSIIISLIEGIYQGNFMPSGENCGYCPNGDICRKAEGYLKEEVSENA
ncbi:MAG: PD-(D/E)XK nuclease family protein [Phascolarctobacterium sp.]|nr:PD-(D/E)XK nuclease family protein [Phascolarctobacterium sp.]